MPHSMFCFLLLLLFNAFGLRGVRLQHFASVFELLSSKPQKPNKRFAGLVMSRKTANESGSTVLGKSASDDA